MKQVKHFRIGILLILAAVLMFCGCNKDKAADDKSPLPEDGKVSQEQMLAAVKDDSIRSLPADRLAALGKKNSINTDFVFPNAHLVKYINPKRFMKYGSAKDVLGYLQSTVMQLPFTDQFEDIDYLVLSSKIILSDLMDPTTKKSIGQPMDTPIQSFFVKMSKPVDKEKEFNLLLKGMDKSKLTKKKYGNLEVSSFPVQVPVRLDDKGEKTAYIDFVQTFCFPTPDTFVIAVGPQAQIDLFYSGSKGDDRGVAAQQFARLDEKNNDFLFFYDFSHPLGCRNQIILFPQNFMQLVAVNSESVFIGINTSASEKESLLKAVIRGKKDADMNKINTEFSAFLMELDRNAKKDAEKMPSLPSFMKDVNVWLKNVKIEMKDAQTLEASITNTKDVQNYCKNMFVDLNKAVDNEKKAQYAMGLQNQIAALSQIFTKYFSKNNKYPPLAIKDAKGTPLLSWRVAVLPAFGPQGEELYKQFKLDEPWNSPNNIKLLEKIPNIYRTSMDKINTSKTVFQIPSSKGTPYSKYPDGPVLKDLENPAKTYLVVAVDPKNAIEWTKPESLAYEPGKLKETFGDFIIGIPFMGDPHPILTNTKEAVTDTMEWFLGIAGNKSTSPITAAAKPAETAKPAAATAKPAETAKPAAATAKPAETAKPAAATAKPAETAKPAAATAKPAETVKPAAAPAPKK